MTSAILTERMMRRCDEMGLTPITAATRAGHQRDTFRNIARGGRPRTDTLEKLASALGTTTSYLLGETNDPEPGAALGGVESSQLDRIERKLDALMKHLGIHVPG